MNQPHTPRAIYAIQLAEHYARTHDDITRTFQLLALERMNHQRGTIKYRALTLAMREQISRLYTLHLAHFGPQCACDKHF